MFSRPLYWLRFFFYFSISNIHSIQPKSFHLFSLAKNLFRALLGQRMIDENYKLAV